MKKIMKGGIGEGNREQLITLGFSDNQINDLLHLFSFQTPILK